MQSDSLIDRASDIVRADGVFPYNGYLWPTEEWWPSHTDEMRHISSRWHFEIVALKDGRFAIDGVVASIQANVENRYYGPDDPPSRPIVFETRNQAIRTAAARMLQDARSARSWTGLFDRMTNETLSDLYNWTIRQIAKATATEPSKPIQLKSVVKVSSPEDGLELFEAVKRRPS